MNFWSSKKGGGSFSTQKFILQILGYKKSKIRVLGMFLSTIVLRKSKTRHTWKKACACISYYLVLIHPCKYVTISIIKKLQHNFPKMRGGSKSVWNSSKNSSSPKDSMPWVCRSFGNVYDYEDDDLLLVEVLQLENWHLQFWNLQTTTKKHDNNKLDSRQMNNVVWKWYWKPVSWLQRAQGGRW